MITPININFVFIVTVLSVGGHTAYIKIQGDNFTDTKTSTIHDFQKKRVNPVLRD